jgi:hypothetical protein
VESSPSTSSSSATTGRSSSAEEGVSTSTTGTRPTSDSQHTTSTSSMDTAVPPLELDSSTPMQRYQIPAFAALASMEDYDEERGGQSIKKTRTSRSMRIDVDSNDDMGYHHHLPSPTYHLHPLTTTATTFPHHTPLGDTNAPRTTSSLSYHSLLSLPPRTPPPPQTPRTPSTPASSESQLDHFASAPIQGHHHHHNPKRGPRAVNGRLVKPKPAPSSGPTPPSIFPAFPIGPSANRLIRHLLSRFMSEMTRKITRKQKRTEK